MEKIFVLLRNNRMQMCSVRNVGHAAVECMSCSLFSPPTGTMRAFLPILVAPLLLFSGIKEQEMGRRAVIRTHKDSLNTRACSTHGGSAAQDICVTATSMCRVDTQYGPNDSQLVWRGLQINTDYLKTVSTAIK